MVNDSSYFTLQDKNIYEISKSQLKYCTVCLSEVVSKGKRLEASVFDVEAMHAYQTINNGKYPTTPLIGSLSPVKRAYYGARLKRNYIDINSPNAIGFVGSAEMLDCYPRPEKFMEDGERTKDLHVKYGDILISRSGTIGNLTFVGKTLEKLLVSEHAIRLECRENPGFVYAFLKSKTGQLLIRSNIYGAVIQEIEPEHLATIPIPQAPIEIKERINKLIVDSYNLRDESNALIDEATKLLIKELQFPDIRDFEAMKYKSNDSLNSFSIRLSNMQYRLDASFHLPIVDSIIKHMEKYALEVTTIGDKRISVDVVLPGRFKRVYVDEEYGVKFLGGKVMHQLDPTSDKYLSRSAHKKQLEGALGIKENSILTPARGSLGDVILPSNQFLSWAISDNMMQIYSYKEICGYVFVFLNSCYGRELIRRFTYGGVVDAIEPEHIKQVEIPLLKNSETQKRINELALIANKKRFEAYTLEQEAINIINKEVIFAK